MGEEIAIVRREVFSVDEGEVTIAFPSNLSRVSIADLRAHFDLLLRKLDRRAGASSVEGYTSDRVFDGKRPLSSSDVDHLKGVYTRTHGPVSPSDIESAPERTTGYVKEWMKDEGFKAAVSQPQRTDDNPALPTPSTGRE